MKLRQFLVSQDVTWGEGDEPGEAESTPEEPPAKRLRGRPQKDITYYPLSDLWAGEMARAPEPEGGCGITMGMANRADPTRIRLQGLTCHGSCSCGRCGPKARQDEIKNMGDALYAMGGCYLLTIASRDWSTIRKRIDRAGGSYKLVEPEPLQGGKELAHVCTSADITGAEWVQQEKAWDTFRRMVQSLPYDHRRIQSSRDWALRPTKTGEWRKLGELPKTPTAYVEELQQLSEPVTGMVVRELTEINLPTGVREVLEFHVPESWLRNGSLDNLIAQMRTGEPLIPPEPDPERLFPEPEEVAGNLATLNFQDLEDVAETLREMSVGLALAVITYARTLVNPPLLLHLTRVTTSQRGALPVS